MAANQPPARPWFRLASIARLAPPPPPPPAPAPTTDLAPPVTPTTASDPTPPQQRPIPARLPTFRPLTPSQPQQTTPSPPSPPTPQKAPEPAAVSPPPSATPSSLKNVTPPSSPPPPPPPRSVVAPVPPPSPPTQSPVKSPQRSVVASLPSPPPPQPQSALKSPPRSVVAPPLSPSPPTKQPQSTTKSPPRSVVAPPPSPVTPKASAPLPPVTISPVRKTSPATPTLPTTTTTSSYPKPKTSPPPPTTQLATSASAKPTTQAPIPISTTRTISPVQKVPNSPSNNKQIPTMISVNRLSPTLTSRTLKPLAQTPPQSPKLKPTAPPPSPLLLPPSQLKLEHETESKLPVEAQQKTITVQKTVDNTNSKPSWVNGASQTHKDPGNYKHPELNNINHSKHQVPKDNHKEKINRKKSSSESEESGIKIITISGENKGAFMEVINHSKKHAFEGNPNYLHKPSSSSKANMSDGSEKWHSYGNSSGEENEEQKMKNNQKSGKTMHSVPLNAFMNSNVQGVNNSIMFHSSCSHHDPGVHLAMSTKPGGNGLRFKDHGSRN